MCVCAYVKSVQSCPALCDAIDCSHRLLCPWGSLGKNIGGAAMPSPGDLPNSGTEPTSLMSPALTDRFFTTSNTWEALLRA